MANSKKALQTRQAKQFSQLLKDYGIVTRAYEPSVGEKRKIDELFPQ